MIPIRALALAVRHSPGTAFAALWAALRGLRVRSRNLIYAAAHQQPGYYQSWTSIIEPRKIESYLRGFPKTRELPQIVGIVFGSGHTSKRTLARTVARMRSAFGLSIIVFTDIADHAAELGCGVLQQEKLGDALESIALQHPNAWLFATIAGDHLSKDTGEALSRALAKSPNSQIVYWDEDRLHGRTRFEPWLKPDWDELLFLGEDFLTGSAVFKISELVSPEGRQGDFPATKEGVSDAVIALVNRMGGRLIAFHIPLILSHRQSQSVFQCASRRKRSIESVWDGSVQLTEIPGIPHALRPQFRADGALPKVSILIPTRNGEDLLRVCMLGVSRVDYPVGVEIIVIDNESDDPATLAYLRHLEGQGVVVLRHPGEFNFSAMNNRAARAATGKLLCLLNNDIEMHDPNWLKSMALHALRPGVGAVGALLQYPDSTVQHAGVIVGTGEAAGHVYRGTPIGESGHRNMHRLTRYVSAVTAACLVIQKELYFEAGGLDETALRVAFNDVDLCLKLSQLGYRNVFAGEALLTHHESKSRGSDFSSQNLARYLGELAHLQEKWGTKHFTDPYGHPLVMRSSESFLLGP